MGRVTISLCLGNVSCPKCGGLLIKRCRCRRILCYFCRCPKEKKVS